MMSVPWGEIAAIATAIMWAVSSTLFALSTRKLSPNIVNRIRLIGALVFIAILHFLLFGDIFPKGATPYQWLILGLSAIIGLVIGDTFLLKAYVIIGPRISMLLMSLAPIVTTAIAWIFMSEHLSPWKVFAIIITISGVAWVVMEKKEKDHIFKVTPKGILFGIGAMVGQAIGLVLSKEGMTGDYPALSATYIRTIWGVVAIWLVTFSIANTKITFRAFKDLKSMRFVVLATIFGPFLGIYLSLEAVKYAPIGIASTLMGLAPLFMIPISFIVFKERITLRAIVGTLIALAGASLLFLF